MKIALRGTFPLAVSALLLVISLVAVPVAPAHVEQPPQRGGVEDSGVQVGIDERLGARIPLDLSFRDETGKQVRLADLVTGPTIILPVYYSCTNVCNYMQEGLARVLPEIKLLPGQDYRVISVSFDENEGPERAARSRRMYYSVMKENFPQDGWRFLTGDAANIRGLTTAAGFRFKRQGRDFMHPVVSLVVAQDGMIVRYLYGTRFLAKDVTLAFMEARQGKVGSAISKMVDYCFSFDPKSKSYTFNLLRVSATVIILSTGSFLAYLIVTGRKGRQGKKISGGK